jgi:hypothetical protein
VTSITAEKRLLWSHTFTRSSSSSDDGDGAGHLKEEKMKVSTISLALCFALAAPLASYGSEGAMRHHGAGHRVDHPAISATATAMVPALKVDHDSDGLSRNHDDCNRGCIDSN